MFVAVYSENIYEFVNTIKSSDVVFSIKGTPMQIWKSPYMLVFIRILRIPRILELFARQVCKFLKKWANLLIYSIASDCLSTNFSHISRSHISKSKRCFNVKSSTYYFHLKTKILADFQICISVPIICLEVATIGVL